VLQEICDSPRNEKTMCCKRYAILLEMRRPCVARDIRPPLAIEVYVFKFRSNLLIIWIE
jgi:hypothetical protein